MVDLVRLVEQSELPRDAPVAVASVDAAGTMASAVSGCWRTGRPVSPDDRFYAASLAKQLTGAAAALLVRDARLDPDAPIADLLGELPEWSRTITARHLAHHMAGLPGAGVAEAVITGHWTEAAVTTSLAQLAALPHAPGAVHLYSNLGYVLLARLVSAATGTAFHAFVAERLLGWDGIGFTAAIETFPQSSALGTRLPLTQGDGGLWTTAPAFALWLAAQNADRLGIESLVTTPAHLGDGSRVDYGWGLGLRAVEGHGLLIHGGAWQGATAKAMRCPALGLSVVVLSSGGTIEAVVSLADAVFAALARG